MSKKKNNLRQRRNENAPSMPTMDGVMYEGEETDGGFLADIDTRVEDLMRENAKLKIQVQELLDTQQSGIVPDDSGALLVRNGVVEHTRVQFSSVAMIFPEDLTEDEWKSLGYTLLSIHSALQWYLGDWLIAGQDNGKSRWGGAYHELAEYFQYEIHTLETYASVCRKIHPSTRVEGLTFTHHRHVTKYEPDEQLQLLEYARDNSLGTRDFEKYLKSLDEDSSQEGLSKQLKSALKKYTSGREKIAGLLENASPEHQDEIRQHLIEEALEIRKLLESI